MGREKGSGGDGRRTLLTGEAAGAGRGEHRARGGEHPGERRCVPADGGRGTGERHRRRGERWTRRRRCRTVGPHGGAEGCPAGYGEPACGTPNSRGRGTHRGRWRAVGDRRAAARRSSLTGSRPRGWQRDSATSMRETGPSHRAVPPPRPRSTSFTNRGTVPPAPAPAPAPARGGGPHTARETARTRTGTRRGALVATAPAPGGPALAALRAAAVGRRRRAVVGL